MSDERRYLMRPIVADDWMFIQTPVGKVRPMPGDHLLFLDDFVFVVPAAEMVRWKVESDGRYSIPDGDDGGWPGPCKPHFLKPGVDR